MILREGADVPPHKACLRGIVITSKGQAPQLLSYNDPTVAFKRAEYKHTRWNLARTLHLTSYS